MACMKIGSKTDAFQRKGQAWFCTTGLPSDVIVEVGEISFHLHKFPLLSRSGFIEKLVAETSKKGEDFVIKLPNIPGGAKSFELVAKFCYGARFELTSSNVVYLRCASDYLEMTEFYGDGNLVSLSEIFLNQVVLRNWKDSIRALQTCDEISPYAEQIGITKRCIESLSMKTSTDPRLFGWPTLDSGGNGGGPIQSPGGGVLWNGISTGARPKNHSSDWWYEDASNLRLPIFKKLISEMEIRGVQREIIAGSLCFYAKKHLPGLHRREDSNEIANRLGSGPTLSEDDQKNLIQELDRLIPNEKGIVSTRFLFGLLRTAMILRANTECVSNLEKRVGAQLDEATLEDLLMPNYSYSTETLYNIESVQRVLDHFLANEEATCGDSIEEAEVMGSPCLTPITMVAKVVDGFLAEVAPDVNLKLPKFQALAAAVPDYARPLDDGLYRAIDIYLKSHPWLAESDREELCRLMDCQKLSLEACTHAAQNERLPLRTIVQVLFFEQLQLRTSIASCFLVSDNLDGGSRHLIPSGPISGPAESQVLKVGMDSMRTRVSELERECSNMRSEIERLGRPKGRSAWETMSKKLGFGFKIKSQMCSAQEGSVSNRSESGVKGGEVREKHGKHRKNLSIEG